VQRTITELDERDIAIEDIIAEDVAESLEPVAVATVSDEVELDAPRRAAYLDNLPERLSALGFVVRAAIIGLLAVRFLLLASNANSSSAFAGFVENVSWAFAWPFANIFGDVSIGSGVIELSTLVAIAVYFLLFKLLRRLAVALGPHWSRRRAALAVWSTEPAAVVEAVMPAPTDEVSETPRRFTGKRAKRRERRLFRLVRAPKS
jgi:hypothetical protein